MNYAALLIWRKMSTKRDELLPSTKDMRKENAVAEGEKASAEMRKRDDAEARKKALIDQLTKPSGVSEEEGARPLSVVRSMPA